MYTFPTSSSPPTRSLGSWGRYLFQTLCSAGDDDNGQPTSPLASLSPLGRYGTTSEALAHGTPFIFVRRDYFNEEPFLLQLLREHGFAIEIAR